MRPLRHALVALRETVLTAGPVLLLALALLAGAYAVLQPNPPREVVLATGVERGAYAEFGRRYAERLQRHGIRVTLRGTQGAAENLALLRQPGSGVDLAFVQGGAAASSDDDALVSLGSMFHEPVWLFFFNDSAQPLLC